MCGLTPKVAEVAEGQMVCDACRSIAAEPWEVPVHLGRLFICDLCYRALERYFRPPT